MKCYLVADESENKIIKVRDEDSAFFFDQYGHLIILEASSLQDLLIKLSEELNSEQAEKIQAALIH